MVCRLKELKKLIFNLGIITIVDGEGSTPPAVSCNPNIVRCLHILQILSVGGLIVIVVDDVALEGCVIKQT